MSDKENAYDEIININNLIFKEKDFDTVLSKIVDYILEKSKADGTFLYIVNDEGYLNLEICRIKSLQINKNGSDNITLYPTSYLPDLKNAKKISIAEASALHKEIINYANVATATDYNTNITKFFEKENNYTIVSCLALPIINRKGQINAVIQFINEQDNNGKIITFTQNKQNHLQNLCNLLGIALENHQLRSSYNQLLESFIEVLARAIDAKSPYTGAHCQRVPVIARMLTTAAVQETTGPLKNFDMSRDDWYALNIASWLHDCGKITTPEYIVDKATKLETIYNRIHEIRDRFEILRRDAHIEYLKKRLAGTEDKERLQAEFVAKVAELEDNFNFIAKCFRIVDNTNTLDGISGTITTFRLHGLCGTNQVIDVFYLGSFKLFKQTCFIASCGCGLVEFDNINAAFRIVFKLCITVCRIAKIGNDITACLFFKRLDDVFIDDILTQLECGYCQCAGCFLCGITTG